LQLFNTLTGLKEDFRPIDGKGVRMYVCGPTVYDVCHMGHARSYTVFDVLVRYLRLLGYDVRLVINFTDVEERITDRAEEVGENPLEFAEGRIQEFFKVMDEMGIRRAESYPRVSKYVPQMIEVVEDLLARGQAYHLGGKIFFDVNSAGGYGDLLHVPPEEAVVPDDPGEGIEAQRRGPFDFEVWDGTVEKEPIWDSPWGKGRIGWHIECYVMSKILGHPIDIKGGGLDLVFPHHESTKLIASALGEELSKFYMHNAFLTFDQQKMSKSKGIYVSISDGLESHDPESLRFFLLGLHYRRNLNYTDDAVVESATKLGEIKGVVKDLARSSEDRGGDDSKLMKLTEILENEFFAGMGDDLDTPRVLDALSDFASGAGELYVGKSSAAKALEILDVIGSVLGLKLSASYM
jgi:cysteinyl-tRNA synthetase